MWVFVLVWPQTWRKQRWARTKTCSTSAGVGRMVDDPRLIQATGSRWRCDHHETSGMKAKESVRWADFTIYDQSWCSPVAVCDWNKLGWGDHRCRCDLRRCKVSLRCTILSLLGSSQPHLPPNNRTKSNESSQPGPWVAETEINRRNQQPLTSERQTYPTKNPVTGWWLNHHFGGRCSRLDI